MICYVQTSFVFGSKANCHQSKFNPFLEIFWMDIWCKLRCNFIDSVKWVWLGPPRINVTTFVNLLSQALLFQILYCHFVTMAEPEIFQQCHQHLVLYHILCFYPKSKQFVRNIQYKSENSINNVLQHILEHSLFDVMSHIYYR